MTPEEAWRILGLSPSATRQQLERKRRLLIRAHHPDRHHEDHKREHEEELKRVNEAYDTLLSAIGQLKAEESDESAGREEWDGEPPPVSVAVVNAFTRSVLTLEERWLQAIVSLAGRIEGDPEAVPSGDLAGSPGVLILRLFRSLCVLCGAPYASPSVVGDLNRAGAAILGAINSAYHRRDFVKAPVALATALEREVGAMYFGVYRAREQCRRRTILRVAPEVRRAIESWFWWDELTEQIRRVGSETWNDELIARWIEERILERAVLRKARNKGHDDDVDEVGRMVEEARSYPDVKFVELAQAELTEAEARYIAARLSSPTLIPQAVARACQGRKKLHWILKDGAQQFGFGFLLRSMRVIAGLEDKVFMHASRRPDTDGLGFAVQWRYEELGLELIASSDGTGLQLDLSRCREIGPEVALSLASLIWVGGGQRADRRRIGGERERAALKVLVELRERISRADAALSGARRAHDEGRRVVQEQAERLRTAENESAGAARRMDAARTAVEQWADGRLEILASEETRDASIRQQARTVQAIRRRRAEVVEDYARRADAREEEARRVQRDLEEANHACEGAARRAREAGERLEKEQGFPESAGKVKRLAVSVRRLNILRRARIEDARRARDATRGEVSDTATRLNLARAMCDEVSKDVQRESRAREKNLAELREEERGVLRDLCTSLARRAAEADWSSSTDLAAIASESREAERAYRAMKDRCDELKATLRRAQSDLEGIRSENLAAEGAKGDLERVWLWLTGESILL